MTPEFPQPNKRLSKDQHLALLATIIGQMRPKVLMLMLHNGHMPDADWDKARWEGEGNCFACCLWCMSLCVPV